MLQICRRWRPTSEPLRRAGSVLSWGGSVPGAASHEAGDARIDWSQAAVAHVEESQVGAREEPQAGCRPLTSLESFAERSGSDFKPRGLHAVFLHTAGSPQNGIQAGGGIRATSPGIICSSLPLRGVFTSTEKGGVGKERTPAANSGDDGLGSLPDPSGPPEGAFSMTDMEFLERMLAEMEGSLAGSPSQGDQNEGDQFVASLQLRLAQEYLAQKIEEGKAEELAERAWKYFGKSAPKGDIVRALTLHVLGTCQARKGDFLAASATLQHSVEAAREVRAAAKQQHQKRKIKPAGARKSSGKRLDAGAGKVDGMAAQGEATAQMMADAASAEFSSQMMLGEICETIAQLDAAAKHYRAAISVAKNEPQLASNDGLRDACFGLATIQVRKDDYKEALKAAETGNLGHARLDLGLDIGAQKSPEDFSEEESREAFRLVREKRLLSSIHLGLGLINSAADELKGARALLAAIGAPPLELAAADVATAEVLLYDSVLDVEEQSAGDLLASPNAPDHDSTSITDDDATHMLDSDESPVDPRLQDEELERRHGEALALLTSAARVQVEELGPNHAELASTNVVIAEACLQLGKTEQAEQCCNEALAVLKAKAGESKGPEATGEMEGVEMQCLPETMARLGVILANLDRTSDAKELVLKAEELLLQEPGREKDALNLLVDFASLLLSLDRAAEAWPIIKRGQEQHGAGFKKHPLLAGDFCHVKACTLSETGDMEGAYGALIEAKEIASLHEGTDGSHVLLKINATLVDACIQLGKPDQAIATQEEVVQIMISDYGPEDAFVEGAVQKLEELKSGLPSE